MTIKRIETKSFLGPIQVNTSSSAASPIGTAVVNFADSVRQRHYDIAVSEAKESGQLAAAEADLTSITNIHKDTGKPEIISQALGMGRFQQEAFEDAVYLRFTNTMDTAINNKAEELQVKYENENNAPELFTEEFKNYLEGLGGNAKGFYKQYIIDRGGNYLENKRTQLEIDRTRRIYQETLKQKEEIKAKSLESAFNLGFSGDYAQVANERLRLGYSMDVFDKVGGLKKNEKEEFEQEHRLKIVQGIIARLLQKEDVATESDIIFQYFQSIGSKHLYNRLTPAAKDAIKEIKNVVGPTAPSDFLKIAQENKASFENAEASGNQITLFEQEKQAQIEAMGKALAEEKKRRRTLGIDNATSYIVKNIESDQYRNWGTVGSITSLRQQITYLNSLDSTIGSSNEFNSEKHNKLLKQIEAAKDQIAEGLVQRLMMSSDGQKNAEEIKNIFESGNYYSLSQFMPSLHMNLFKDVADSDNKKAFMDIASGTQKNVKLDYDRKLEAISLQLDNDARAMKELAADPSSTYTQLEMAQVGLSRKYENIKDSKIVKQLNSIIEENLSEKNTKLQEQQNEEFDVTSTRIAQATDTENFIRNIDEVQKLGKTLNIDRESIKTAIQNIFDQATLDRFSIGVSAKATEENVNFLNALASHVNPKGTTFSSQLNAETRKSIDALLNDSYTSNGETYLVDRDKVYNLVKSVLSDAERQLANDKKVAAQQRTDSYIDSGVFVPTLYTSVDGRANLRSSLERLSGGPIHPDTFIFSDAERAEMSDEQKLLLDKQYKLMKQSGNITEEFNNAFIRLENNNLGQGQSEAFFRNVREFGIVDSGGSFNLKPAVYQVLGPDAANRLKAYYHLYTFFPEPVRESMLAQVIDRRLDTPISADDFKTRAGYKSPLALINDIAAIPDEIQTEFTEIAELLVPVHGKNPKHVIANMIDARFTSNANMYSPITNSSLVPNDFGSTKDELAPYLYAINMKVDDLKSTNPQARYFFDPDSKVTVEDISAGQAFFIKQMPKDLFFGNETEEVARINAGEQRVVFGPTLQSSAAFPQGQLYAIVSGSGAIQPIPNTVFDLKTDWLLNGFEEYGKFKTQQDLNEKEKAKKLPAFVF